MCTYCVAVPPCRLSLPHWSHANQEYAESSSIPDTTPKILNHDKHSVSVYQTHPMNEYQKIMVKTKYL